MMVMPLTVVPSAAAPAAHDGAVESADAAAEPFLAILAAAVATPLPEPSAPALPTPIAAVPEEGIETEAGDASGHAPQDAVPPVPGTDAPESRADSRLHVIASDRSPSRPESRQPAPGASEATSQDPLAEPTAAEPLGEDVPRSEPGAEAVLTSVDGRPRESVVASTAIPILQSSPKLASASVGTEESFTQAGEVDTARRANPTPGTASTVAPPSAARATAAGVLAALSMSIPEQDVRPMQTPPALNTDRATPVTVATLATASAPPASTPDAAHASLLQGASVSAVSTTDLETRIAPPAPVVTPVAKPSITEAAAPRATLAEMVPAEERAETTPALARGARLAAPEDAPSESAQPVRAPWVATPTVLPEARGDVPDASFQPSERAPVRAESASPSHVTVELDPETAGASRVRVAVRGDVVHATVVTDAGGADAMRPQLGELRQALEGQGFREATVQVRTSGEGGAPSLAASGADVRGRHDSAAPGEGQTQEHHPRGRQRGHDQSTADQRAPTDPDEEQT